MRVRATASGSFQSNAIGQVELSCTPPGLSIGLFGVGSYADGYATAALTHGTRFTLPYASVRVARSQGAQLYLELDSPTFPHDRLVLTQFSPGPGVPILELRRRRLILHVCALSVAAMACLAATILAPTHPSETLAWGALGYGALAGCLVLALGFALDQSLFVRPPSEALTREAFVRELSHYVPHLVVTDLAPQRRVRKIPDLTTLLPRSAAGIGLLLAATVLTALVTGERLLLRKTIAEETYAARGLVATSPIAPASPTPASAPPTPSSAPDRAIVHSQPSSPAPASPTMEAAPLERRCLCDRADSQLWKSPIPRLSTLLIERRSLPLKNYVRTQLEVGVVNNGDAPINDLTIHVQFYERKGVELRPTKERPLYFEGPLSPGAAIKWSTEARGTDFEIIAPDLGSLGPNGDGSAPREAFVTLLEANHRPVRLHAARLLSFLGDPGAREAALHLKDAMRSAEAPYLRRILMATGETRVCDIELRQDPEPSVGACVYNASENPQANLGVQLNALSHSLDAAHPLADPPELLAQQKWTLPGEVPKQSGVYVRVPLPAGPYHDPGVSIEVVADRFDLLD